MGISGNFPSLIIKLNTIMKVKVWQYVVRHQTFYTFNSPLAPISLLLRPGGFGGRGPGAEQQVVKEGEVEEAGCCDDEPVLRGAGEG